MPTQVQNKNILDIVNEIKLEQTRQGATMEIQFANIIKRQDVANGKLATHEAVLQSMQIKESVQASKMDDLKARDADIDSHNQKVSLIWRDKLLGSVITLIIGAIGYLVAQFFSHLK